ncbi:MAG: hypothetical protein ACRC57_08365 [Sarcina sp.]
MLYKYLEDIDYINGRDNYAKAKLSTSATIKKDYEYMGEIDSLMIFTSLQIIKKGLLK